ncbi:hypothetical protein BJX66DRAFT_320797 [Aspergillus keveii]|uniref:F-box domain-containing protein n=1 Tax=Aspergillus keveii TaxID=714993 RepID=A0ABR4FGR3_9EURO
MLQDLPSELLTEILSLLEKPDLAHVRIASKQLEPFATPLLFSDITVHVDENDLVHIPIQRALSLSFGSERNFLHFAKRITFTSQFRKNYTKRCPHHRRPESVDGESDRGSSGEESGDGENEDEETDMDEGTDGEASVGPQEKTNPSGEMKSENKNAAEEKTPRGTEREGGVKPAQKREEADIEDDESEDAETRYPDDDILDKYELTEIENRDVRRYIPWEWDVEVSTEITQIKNRIMAMLIRCREGSLTEFNWDLGICCPGAILSDDGILPRCQKNIETIRLVGDARCFGHEYYLADFRKLKRLTWIPLTSQADFDSLALTLEKLAHQLTLLELDIYEFDRKIAWRFLDYHAKSRKERERPNYFAWDTLGLYAKQKKCVFPSLERLYLCGVPFGMAEMELAHAFDWSKLQSLHLRFCGHWKIFLQEVIGTRQTIRLTSLTLEPSPVLDYADEEVETICVFLTAFTGLRDLCLSTNEEHGTLEIWRAVANHKATLRTFVHNQRISSEFWGTDWDDIGDVDPPTLPFTDDELEMMSDDPATNPLSDLDLEFLGLTVAPEDMTILASPFRTKPTLHLLHIRQAGAYSNQYGSWGVADYDLPTSSTEALADFGSWAFGPGGIPSLKGLAFGDFSYDNRHVHDRYLTMVALTDPPLDRKFERELAACPQDELVALDRFPWRVEEE